MDRYGGVLKNEKEDNRSGSELQFELKYCERCGGLWLRPAGGAQVYCVGCAREMAQLPPASKEPETARMFTGPKWGTYQDDEMYEGEETDPDAAGGAA